MQRRKQSHPRIAMLGSLLTMLAAFGNAILHVGCNLVTGKYFQSFGPLFAKVQYGEMIADMRGKINGTVHSRNRAGSYMRNKVTPVNPQTTYQTGVRNFLTAIAQDWRGLTQAARDAWNSAVSNFQRTNVFGQLRTPSGFNLHARLNLNLLNVNEAAITSPPVPSTVEAITSLSVAADDSANTVIVTFAPAITAASKILLEATEPLSPGIGFAKNQFRKIAVLDNTDVSPYDASADYSAKFGSTPVEGTKIFVRVTVIDISTGLSGIPLTASTITVA